MNINEYNELFIEKFKVNSSELHSEFARVMNHYGSNEEVKIEFYSKLFETIISQFKKDLPKDENYGYVISTFYNYFIDALEVDKIDNTKYKQELLHFKKNEVTMISKVVAVDKNNFEAVYKNYNPNTKYGRRKAREQASSNYQNGTPEYRKEIDNIGLVVWIIIFIIAIIIFLIKVSLK
jgi:hypothetical protein